jgi:hypothetical protein
MDKTSVSAGKSVGHLFENKKMEIFWIIFQLLQLFFGL